MSDAKFDGADMTEVVMSKAYAAGASFKGNLFPCPILWELCHFLNNTCYYNKFSANGDLFISKGYLI